MFTIVSNYFTYSQIETSALISSMGWILFKQKVNLVGEETSHQHDVIFASFCTRLGLS